jgi:general secretion pathway protein H
MAPTHPSETGKRAAAGFTLTELLVVLAIVGLIFAAAPALIQAAMPGARSLAAARALANDLRTARGRAIAFGAATDIRFDTAHQTYRLEPGTRAFALPQGVRFALKTQADIIVFYPDGSSNGGAVTVGDGSNNHRLSVDWFTGRVEIDE